MARKCTACGIRAIGSGAGDDAEYARNMGYCNPCSTRFDHDNDHDNDHNRAPEECWVCTPAIDLSAAPAVKGHINTVAKTRTSHAACDHDVTPAARAACRKQRMANTTNAVAETRPAGHCDYCAARLPYHTSVDCPAFGSELVLESAEKLATRLAGAYSARDINRMKHSVMVKRVIKLRKANPAQWLTTVK